VRRLLPLFALCSVLLSAVIAAGAAEDKGPFVSAVRHATLDLIDDGVHNRMDIPLEFVAGIDPSTLTVTLAEVLLGDRLDTQFVQAFHPSVSAAVGLALTVDYTVVKRPGTYHLTFELTETRRDPKAAPRRQRITVDLVHPSAKLRIPSPLVIVQTVGLWGPPEVAPETITISEESRKSRAVVQFSTVSGPTHDGESVSGSIAFKDAVVAPGKAVKATPELTNSFPIGASKATLAVRADQIDDTTVFDVEVRSKRDPKLIFPIVLISALLGWLLRVYLKRKEDFLALVQQADKLVTLLQAERGMALPDDRTELDQSMGRLNLASAGDDEDEVTAAMAVGNQRLTASQQHRAAWRTEALASLGKIQATLATPWRLPIDADLPALRAEADAAIAAARLGDIRAAGATTAALSTALSAFITPGRSWAQSAVNALTAAENSLGTTFGSDPRPSAAAATTTLAAAIELDAATSPGADALPILHAARSRLVDYARDTAWRLDNLAADVVDALAAPAHATTLRKAAQLAGDPDANPVLVTDGVREVVGRFTAALNTSIHAIIPGASEEVRTSITAHLRQQQFVAAAQKAHDEAAKPKTNRREISSGPEEEEKLSPASRQPRPVQTQDVVVTSPVERVVVQSQTETVEARRVRTLRRLMQTRILRGAVAALVGAVGATLLYHDSFVGTASEILGLAAVAFMSDFTLESAFDAILKHKE
jgi:hypothetical protein